MATNGKQSSKNPKNPKKTGSINAAAERRKMRTDILIERLKDEKKYGISGGIYNMTQIDIAFNSNHMEGNTLTHEQTRYIYDTHSLKADNIKVDDVIETTNHFRCFDMILDDYETPLTEEFIKSLHYQLKSGTFSSHSKEAVIGDYKKYANYVSDIQTSTPKEVHENISKLLDSYNSKADKTLDDILEFHARFESIHPFYDGNGRVGRLIMFKECLANDIIPFVIREDMKHLYIRGLNEWQHGKEKGFLRDLCVSMQDEMLAKLIYFDIPFTQDNENPKPIYISQETNSYIHNFIQKSSISNPAISPGSENIQPKQHIEYLESSESNQPEYDEPGHRLDKEIQISNPSQGDKR